MPSLPNWSSRSANCHPEPAPEVFLWRPSRQQRRVTALLVVGALAALFLSGLPTAAAVPAAIAVLVRGALLLRRDLRSATLRVELSPDTARVDGVRVEGLSVAWRGPLAFMRWRGHGGRTQRRVWWPDVLAPEARRRLRLATGQESSSPVVASVAP